MKLCWALVAHGYLNVLTHCDLTGLACFAAASLLLLRVAYEES